METDMQNDQETEVEEAPSFFTFYLDEQTFGIDVSHVQELLVMQKITPLPNAPSNVLGVVDVRGTKLPVIDLKACLGMPSPTHDHERHILVVEVVAGLQRKPLGIFVDRVRHVDQIPMDAIQPCPSIGISNWDSSIIVGLSLRGSDPIILLRIDALFGEMIEELEIEEDAA